MKNCPHPRKTGFVASPARQRGVVLLFALIALVIMLIAGVALIRSFNSSLFTAGNIAFKRDMQNQSERATQAALTAFRTGGLSTSGNRSNNTVSLNYSAQKLASDAQGIPTALAVSDAAFDGAYPTTNRLTSSDGSVTVRYLIDRLCAAEGDETTLGSGSCILADNQTPAGTSSSNLQGPERSLKAGLSPASQQGVVYRLSIKVTGPRGTQSFFQSTFTVPT
jgi:Tfp pilus assembly protein PilX